MSEGTFELIAGIEARVQRFLLPACVGVDYSWEREKLEARKMLGNGVESYLSSAP